ncbi:hypothetical protein [Pseudooceanicola spongiae]|jgi:hypothetical protein|uniref:Uncharacterized protein n=1 Tax=Pseudooceanicola spongiae TaxID=2613965 RepID=A0A7L9WPU9_9RHOB|nr:hypothetical protein [Pseudooceanicola spongiae]QOL81090.1 hypothetical protein F3W81_09875 [Pseudooceanicola spongiae]
MAGHSPQTQAKNTVAALIREARAAGWVRARFEIRPDGSVTVEANMIDQEGGDDFLESELRMGR